MKAFLAMAALTLGLAWLSGCASPPRVSTTFKIRRAAPDEIVIDLKVTNVEDHATTPLAVEVSVQTLDGGTWSASATVMHPVPFVLNRHESRDISASVRSSAPQARAKLSIKAQETGKVLKEETVGETFR